MLINKLDNVDINLEDGHKYALRDIKEGEFLSLLDGALLDSCSAIYFSPL